LLCDEISRNHGAARNPSPLTGEFPTDRCQPHLQTASESRYSARMKKIGFLSFGHWTPSSQSQTRSAADTLLQSIDLAVAAEQLGADGAYFRVHHFARQLASPFPLLAAVGARTKRIEIGTAVIDMRYENPMYMAEDAVPPI
jgi:Luciferase-like monooxygenase